MANVLPLMPFINPGALADQATIENAMAQMPRLPPQFGPGPWGREVGPAAGAAVLPGFPSGVPTMPWQKTPMVPRVDVQANQLPYDGGTVVGGRRATLEPPVAGPNIPTQIPPAIGEPNFVPPPPALTQYSGVEQGSIPEQPQYPQVTPDEQVGSQGMPGYSYKPPQNYQPSASDFFPNGEGGQQQQQGGMSDAGMWGLLAAGLGILANNYGNYGNASPALGKGGLIGLETFLGQRQVAEKNKFAQQELDQRQQYQSGILGQGERRTAVDEGQLRLAEGNAKRKEQQDIATRNLALSLAGNDVEQQKIAIANPEKYLDFKVAQLKPEYKDRSVKEGTQAYDEYSIDGGKTWNPVPGGGKYDLRASKGGSINTMTMAGAAEDFNKESLKDQASALMKQYETLQNAPDVINTLRIAREAASKSKNFTGSAGETKLAFAKFFNNNLGTQIDPEGVKNAEILRSSTFRQIMDQLKKLDSQPTQKQQDALQDALGRLATDPSALPEIYQITEDIFRSRADIHNDRVRQARGNGAKFLYDVEIKFPDSVKPENQAPASGGGPGDFYKRGK
jgi:hypothetical protein